MNELTVSLWPHNFDYFGWVLVITYTPTVNSENCMIGESYFRLLVCFYLLYNFCYGDSWGHSFFLNSWITMGDKRGFKKKKIRAQRITYFRLSKKKAVTYFQMTAISNKMTLRVMVANILLSCSLFDTLIVCVAFPPMSFCMVCVGWRLTLTFDILFWFV